MTDAVVLGLDFGGTKIAAAVCDAAGRRLGTTTVQTLPELGARASLARGLDAARALLGSAGQGREPVAVGASTIGIPGEHGIALAPAVPGWSEMVLGRELREAFPGAEVRLATDVKAAAQVEADSGALAGCDPGIYLNLGTGLAVAIVVGGRVVAGRHGASGEVGYNLRTVADVGLGAAERIPLEEIVSGRAFLRTALAEAPDSGDAAGVFERAQHHEKISDLLGDFVAELSFHLVNLAIAIDPARIVVGGGMVRSWNLIEPGLRRALAAAVPYPPELAPAAHPYDAPLLGAIALAITAARERLTRESSAWAEVPARPAPMEHRNTTAPLSTHPQ